MIYTKRQFFSSIFLIIIILISLVNVNVALADDTTPTPPPTEEATQPPSDPTETSVAEETPAATEEPVSTEESSPAENPTPEEQAAGVSEVFSGLPENTDVVVLDEAGNPVPLASQAAAEAILEIDPMWCPAGVLPGGAGCSPNFATIDDLRVDMINNTSSYLQNGVIYFTATAGSTLNFQQATLTAVDYNALKVFDLTFQGGWNGSTVSPAFSGQTNFASNRFQLGSSGNPWVGNVTLRDFTFSDGTAAAVLIFTSSGNITLDNVDVTNQVTSNAASLTSTSGNITIQNNSVFDGNDSTGNGVSVTTGTGTVSISDSTFQQFKRSGLVSTWDGLTVSAPTVNLTNVTATDNDGDGISITNANIVTLNNVTSSNNGTELGAAGLASNDGSGVVVSGPAGSNVYVLGGTFNNNQEYGIEIGSPANTTLNIFISPTCTGNDSNSPPTSSCYNVTTIVDLAPPVITYVSQAPAPNGNGWNNSSVTVTWSCTDALSGPASPTVTTTVSSEGANQSATGTCFDVSGNSASDTHTGINIDLTGPTLNLPPTVTVEATSPAGAVANYSVSASDNLDPSPGILCDIPSGSAFSMGTTTVTCTATDQADNTSTGTFDVLVQDTSAPAISPMADIYVESSGTAKFVTYTPPATFDLLDGAGVATCSPGPGTLFPFGSTVVTCSASDTSGNTSSITFSVIVWRAPKNIGIQQGSASGAGIIVVTGGEQVNLGCFTQLYAYGVKLTFLNLCGHQTVVSEMGSQNLPANLPAGYTFVSGLNVLVLNQGQPLGELPVNTGIELDFPSPGTATYALMFWDGTQWIEVTESANAGDLASLLANSAGSELYLIGAGGGHMKALTTELTGIFVLATK